MTRWDQRPIEIRNLFNPAFCGLVLIRSLVGFEEEDQRGMPFSLSLLILPLSLHKHTREVLLNRNRSYFLKILADHPNLAIDFGIRATNLLPFTFEALGLLMQLGTFTASTDGRLKAVPDGVRKTVTGTSESVACQRVARYLGKEFGRIADRATIYSTLGIRP